MKNALFIQQAHQVVLNSCFLRFFVVDLDNEARKLEYYFSFLWKSPFPLCSVAQRCFLSTE